jgi:hypothetical protein
MLGSGLESKLNGSPIRRTHVQRQEAQESQTPRCPRRHPPGIRAIGQIGRDRQALAPFTGEKEEVVEKARLVVPA